MHVLRLPTVERFVGFYRPSHGNHGGIFQYVSEPLQNEPCSLLADSQITRNLIGTDAVLAVDQQPHCGEPFGQGDRAILEDRANLDRELLVALVALPTLLLRQPVVITFSLSRITLGAYWGTVLPAQVGDRIDAGLFVREVSDCF